jgi:hypothetical protein
MGTHLGLSHPYHGGDSRNGTERFPSLRTPRIVPSNRRLRFDGPHFSDLAVGGPVSLHAHSQPGTVLDIRESRSPFSPVACRHEQLGRALTHDVPPLAPGVRLGDNTRPGGCPAAPRVRSRSREDRQYLRCAIRRKSPWRDPPRRTSRPGVPCREKPGLIPGKGTETQTSLIGAKGSGSAASNRFRRLAGAARAGEHHLGRGNRPQAVGKRLIISQGQTSAQPPRMEPNQESAAPSCPTSRAAGTAPKDSRAYGRRGSFHLIAACNSPPCFRNAATRAATLWPSVDTRA